MLKIIFVASVLTFPFNYARAEQAPIGCVVVTYDCYPQSGGAQKCSWGYDVGRVYSIDLQKTASSPNYDIWEGKISGKARGHDYQISVYQRREANVKVNYLTANLFIDNIQITGQGQNTVEARYLLTPKNDGVGIRCSMDITPTP